MLKNACSAFVHRQSLFRDSGAAHCTCRDIGNIKHAKEEFTGSLRRPHSWGIWSGDGPMFEMQIRGKSKTRYRVSLRNMSMRHIGERRQ